MGNPTLHNISHYRQTTNIIRTLIGNTIVDHSDEVDAAPVGAAPDLIPGFNGLGNDKNLIFGIWWGFLDVWWYIMKYVSHGNTCSSIVISRMGLLPDT